MWVKSKWEKNETNIKNQCSNGCIKNVNVFKSDIIYLQTKRMVGNVQEEMVSPVCVVIIQSAYVVFVDVPTVLVL